jgi:DNA-binding Lrp family transcriptional regulator
MNEFSTSHARTRSIKAYALTGDADYLLKVAAPDLSGLARIINDLILPQATLSHVKSSIVLTTLKDSHRLPLRAALRLVITSARKSEAPRR